MYGREAKRLATVNEGCTVTDLFERAKRQEKVRVGAKNHDAVWLLAKFFRLALAQFRHIEYLTFSVPYTDIDISKMLKGVGQFVGVPKESVYVQDYKESFCHYMFYQPKELWQYEAALFTATETRSGPTCCGACGNCGAGATSSGCGCG